MRFFKSMTALMLVLSISFAFTACGDTATETETAVETAVETTVEAAVEAAVEAPHGEGKEFTSAYVCPMHCTDSGSDAEGKCPTCGMAYVAQTEHTGNGHKH